MSLVNLAPSAQNLAPPAQKLPPPAQKLTPPAQKLTPPAQKEQNSIRWGLYKCMQPVQCTMYACVMCNVSRCYMGRHNVGR